MTQNKETLAFTIDADIAEKIKRLKVGERSRLVNFILRRNLDECLAEYEKFFGKGEGK